MAWTQIYDPAGGALLSALLAGIPLFALFYMLAVRRAKGHYAAATAVILSFLLAVLVWGMPVGTAFSSLIYGAAFGLFPIIWIVITAVWVYNMTVESGEFEHIKQSLARLTDDRRLQAIFRRPREGGRAGRGRQRHKRRLRSDARELRGRPRLVERGSP